jgi:hypothetical protein
MRKITKRKLQAAKQEGTKQVAAATQDVQQAVAKQRKTSQAHPQPLGLSITEILRRTPLVKTHGGKVIVFPLWRELVAG